MEETLVTLRDGRQVAVRHARVDDADQLVKAVDTVSREVRWFLRGAFDMSAEEERRYIAGLNPNNEAFFVATLEGHTVGWLTINRGRAEYTRHTAEFGMGVLGPHRGLGIGEVLVCRALDWAKSLGIEKVCLGVRASNERAIRLYARLGFVEEGRRSRYVKTPEGYDDDILMARFL